MKFRRLASSVVSYRDYKTILNEGFVSSLGFNLTEENIFSLFSFIFEKFYKIFV